MNPNAALVDAPDMDQKPKDTANEPVDTSAQPDDEFMDTGVLHEPKVKAKADDDGGEN